jgi:CobQ-like glutamine amidotransferase family enzyme
MTPQRIIRTWSYRPEYFNNNSDQANLLVLRRQLQWRGMDLEPTADLELAEFVLIGDGSRAAIREFAAELEELVPKISKRFKDGSPTLIVGSAFEFFLDRIPELGILTRGERSSEFRVAKDDSVEAFGYRNTDLMTDLKINGSFVATTLFGPVLAKSPQLLDLILEGLGIVGELDQALLADLTELLQQIRQTNAG